MPSKSTGTLTQNADGSYTARVTLQKHRLSFALPHCTAEAGARERLAVLATLAARMTAAKTELESAKRGLARIAESKPGQTLKVACTLVDDLIAGWRPKASNVPTFLEVAERWHGYWLRDNPDTTAKPPRALHAEYPGTVEPRAETSRRAAGSNLQTYILKSIGHLPVDEITVEHCDAIKHALPAHLRNDSRRQILMPLKTVLGLCVHPLKLIPASPLPAKWLPKAQGPRTLQWLYPDEDAQLMACTAVPLHLRMLFGFLIREGTRSHETIDTTLANFDLRRGVCRLTAGMTKTATARMWQLDAGTTRALTRWVELARADAGPADSMFIDERGRPWGRTRTLPDLLRAALQLAGVTRPELYTTTADSRQLAVHDLRGSFATVKLALPGVTEKWVRQRTGHESSVQLAVYDRLVQTFRELAVGDFVPLDEAIPELRQRCVSEKRKPLEMQSAEYSIVKPTSSEQAEQPRQLSGTTQPTSALTALLETTADASATLRIEDLQAQLELVTARLERVQSERADDIARAVVAALRGEMRRPSSELEAE